MTKTHSRQCNTLAGEPCKEEHTYSCGDCGDEFTVDQDSQLKLSSGVLAGRYWPVCSLKCYSSLYPTSDPNLVKKGAQNFTEVSV